MSSYLRMALMTSAAQVAARPVPVAQELADRVRRSLELDDMKRPFK